MNDEAEPASADADGVDALRSAAGDVVASLQHFLAVAADVIDDRDTFAQVIEDGQGAVGAFVEGFLGQVRPPDEADDDANAEGGENASES